MRLLRAILAILVLIPILLALAAFASLRAASGETARPVGPFLSAPLSGGARGDAVLQLQDRLASLGYWSGRRDARYGLLTAQAVLAFQKVEGLPRTGAADRATLDRLATATRPEPRSPSGDLVEVDKARQVLFVVRGGRVAWVLNTSTGSGRRYRSQGRWQVADTPEGRWVVQRAVDGLRRAALGTMYRPRYFHRDGIALHGSPEVGALPASHGCVRLTNAAVDWLWAADVTPVGSTVWVY